MLSFTIRSLRRINLFGEAAESEPIASQSVLLKIIRLSILKIICIATAAIDCT